MLTAEDEDALQHMKKATSPELDKITLEETEAVCGVRIEVITKFLHDIYNSVYIPGDLFIINYLLYL